MFVFLSVVTVIVLCFIFISRLIAPRSVKLAGKHVLITGGSSGIGKSIAMQAAYQGANVTIVARNKERLEQAVSDIHEHLQTNREVHSISVDLSSEYEPVKKAVEEAEEKLGPVFMVINSAGGAVAKSFQDLHPNDFKKQMELNYYSAINTTKAVVSSMIQQQAGRIVFLSSQAGQIGLFGYTAYSGAKFALRGMAEALQMEMAPHNIRVTVSFPPDTDTPGFKSEQDGKPKETELISATAGLLEPDLVAKNILSNSLRGSFVSYQGLDGWMLANITAGMAPVTSLVDVLTQFTLMGILRVVGAFYLASFNSIVLKCKNERATEKPKSS